MSIYRFGVGDVVRMTPTNWPGTPTGRFEVVSRHGADGPDPSYRLRDCQSGVVRMAAQSALQADAPQAV
jgi:hypothetical protein